MDSGSTATVRARASQGARPRLASSAFAAVLVLAGLGFAVPGVLGPFVSGSAAAQDLTPDQARAKREEQARQLEAAKSREGRISRDLESLKQERAQLNRRLVESAAEIQQTEKNLTQIETRLTELAAREAQMRIRLGEQQDVIAELLAALQRMGRNPPPVMATRRDDALEMVRSAILLATVFPDLRDKAVALASELDELIGVIETAKAESIRLREQQQKLLEGQKEVDLLLSSKQDLLEKGQVELAEIKRLAALQADRVRNLDELITRLDKVVEDRGKLGEYQAELEQGTAPGQRETAALPSAVELRPSEETIGRKSNHDRLKPAIPFEKARNMLPLPVSGRRVVNFRDKIQIGQSKGIVIETRHGAQVTSPSDGWVVYAGEFRSYGQLLIINAGGDYHLLLAGLTRIDVAVGQFVVSGEPIGRMRPEVRQAQGGSDPAPVLYVEFRHKGRPVDPDPWWSGSRTRVEG